MFESSGDGELVSFGVFLDAAFKKWGVRAFESS